MEQDARNQRLMDEVQNELRGDFERSALAVKAFQDKYYEVMGKLDKFYKSKCPGPIQWLEVNTINSQEGPRLKDVSLKDELEKQINSLQRCIETHDVGSTRLLEEFDNTFNEIGSRFNSGLEKCLGNKNDNDAKNCLKNFLSTNFNELNKVYADFTPRFEAVNSKL